MVKLINAGFDNEWKLFSYDQWGSESYISVDPNEKIAVRFSPTFDGKITGVFFFPSTTVGLTGPLYAEVWSDNAGLPDSKLGNTVNFYQDKILKYSWNYIDLTGTGVSVYSGNDYHMVLYFTSGTTTYFRYENVSSDHRSSVNSGMGWSAFANDLRIRPVMTKDISALPVELATFNAAADGQSIKIIWETITEINNYGFEVERKESYNKIPTNNSWQKIFFINGNGTSNIPHKYSFADKYVKNNFKYYYRLKIIDFSGKVEYSPEIKVDFHTPVKFNLAQNHPNPFNPSTTINFELASKCNVLLKIYDALGNEVQTLLNEVKPAGKHKVEFNGTKLSSGIYFYKITAPDFVEIKKMILLK